MSSQERQKDGCCVWLGKHLIHVLIMFQVFIGMGVLGFTVFILIRGNNMPALLEMNRAVPILAIIAVCIGFVLFLVDRMCRKTIDVHESTGAKIMLFMYTILFLTMTTMYATGFGMSVVYNNTLQSVAQMGESPAEVSLINDINAQKNVDISIAQLLSESNTETTMIEAGFVKAYAACCLHVSTSGINCNFISSSDLQCSSYAGFKQAAAASFTPEEAFEWMLLVVGLVQAVGVFVSVELMCNDRRQKRKAMKQAKKESALRVIQAHPSDVEKALVESDLSAITA